ncbi:DNA-directed RNA polymerase subunit epsilon [Halorussus marinus]|uniref:DNA-directed RNA polymerase subunit epsilon n=1 Tax=Halorussus marinus TaxID=2505976 RepID=UPI00106EF372|nr:DNA-directed RNA polymerase subunit epsilon [Halorussus marinus]
MTESDSDAALPTWQHDPADDRHFSRRAGDGAVARADLQRDGIVRQWGPVTPAATQIGRARSPDADLSDSVRRLHEERHAAMAGHSERMHRLDKLRITHALCNDLSLTPWQRDRVIGVMADLDLTAFGSQRAIPKVALVTIRHVVDTERERYLGLHDAEWIGSLPPERLEALYDQFDSITDDPAFADLAEKHGIDITSLNRLRRVLRDQIDERGLDEAVHGHNPYRDPNLPSLETRGSGDGRSGGFEGTRDQ